MATASPTSYSYPYPYPNPNPNPNPWLSNPTLVLLTPAKTPTYPSATLVILRTPCPILHPPKPISAKPFLFLTPPGAYPPHQPREYVYPDPIPAFAQAETQKFKRELFNKLCKDRDTFGDDLDAVIAVCVQVFNNFLHNEYGGPGTLLVEPFTDMFVALKERKLPGAPVAARASLLWAQSHVDHDWEVWNSNSP